MTPFEESKYLEGCVKRIDRVLGDPEVPDTTKEYMTPLCPECNMDIRGMNDQQLLWHRIYRGNILIACEGYLVIDPMLAGVNRDSWSDWTKIVDETADDAKEGDEE